MIASEQQSRTTLPQETPGDDPLLRLQAETEPDETLRIRVTTHADAITITGITVMCPTCGACRDWMVVCDATGRVFLRCRCAHQWYEPELSGADFDAMIGEPGHKYTSLEAVARDTGHDGAMAGTYLPGDLEVGVCGPDPL